MTRFLCGAIPSKMYKAHPGLVDAFLKQLQRDFTELFANGIVAPSGETFRAALIGVKGDYEFHLEVGQLTRSYQNVGRVADHPYCPECKDAVAGVDMQPNPNWTGSLYASEPWQTTPVLSNIPYSGLRRASLYRRDPFHTLKYGFLRDLAAGIILYLAQLQYFDYEGDRKNLESRLARAYSAFKMFCVAEGKTSTLRKFSVGNLHIGRKPTSTRGLEAKVLTV